VESGKLVFPYSLIALKLSLYDVFDLMTVWVVLRVLWKQGRLEWSIYGPLLTPRFCTYFSRSLNRFEARGLVRKEVLGEEVQLRQT